MTRLSRHVAVALPFILAACSQQPRGPFDASSSDRMITIGPTQETPEEIQSEVMIFVDRYWAVVSQALDDVRRAAESPQRRLGAQSLKIAAVESAVRIATDSNPVVAVLDMTVMVTLMRQVWDEHWAPNVYHEPPGGPVSQAFASLEQEMWQIAGRIFIAQDIDALHQLIADMRAAYPDQVYVVNLRASEFAAERQRAIQTTKGGPSLLALFAIDPLASLTPATRELQASRLLAERAFFYATRLPGLLSWRTDRALLFAAAMPEVAEARDTVNELRAAGDRIGALAETIMPELERQRAEAFDQLFAGLSAERSAAVNEVFDRIAAERRALVEALRSGGEAGAFLGELNTTAATATTLSDSLRETIVQGRELTRAISEFRSGDDGGRPFDIREYQAVTMSATQTAKELTALVSSLNELLRSSEWSARGGDAATAINQAAVAGSGLVNRAFALGFGLVAFTVVSVFGAAIGYRVVASRLRRPA